MSIAAEVSAALREAGVATAGAPLIAQIVRTSQGAQTPWDTRGFTETETFPVAVVVDTFAQAHIDGTLVRADDLRVMAEAVVEPTTADKLRIDGKDHAILSVRALKPGGVALMYEMQCRR